MKTKKTNPEDFVLEYQSGRFTNQELARRYQVSGPTITSWVHKAGLKTKSAGRPRLTNPTERQIRIIQLCQRHRMTDVAKMFAVSKQAIHQTVARWGTWRSPNHHERDGN